MKAAINGYQDTGYGPLDAEHQPMRECIRRVLDAVNAGDARDVATRLGALLSATRAHFFHEQRLMVDHHYPAYARHKAVHEQFIKELEQHLVLLSREGLTPPFRRWTTDAMTRWFPQHGQAHDAALGAFLVAVEARAHEVTPAPSSPAKHGPITA